MYSFKTARNKDSSFRLQRWSGFHTFYHEGANQNFLKDFRYKGEFELKGILPKKSLYL